MVSFTQLACGLVTAAALSQAAPSGSGSAQNNGLDARDCEFSWEKWITDMMDDPEGDHLSVKEAVKASEECRRPELSTRDAADAKCTDKARTGSEAAGNALTLFAGRPDKITVYPIGYVYWHQGNVWFTGTASPGKTGGTASATYDVARGLGWIMDKCTHDGTVGGTGYAKGNGDLLLRISNNKPF